MKLHRLIAWAVAATLLLSGLAPAQTTMPAPTTLPSGAVGLQPRSNTTYTAMNWVGGYQALLIQGPTKNVNIESFRSLNASGYGIFESMTLGLNDTLTFHDIDIEMPGPYIGEHDWRIYGERNCRHYGTKLVNHAQPVNNGVVFTGTTLALKESDGCLWVDTLVDGWGPAFGPLPLPSEVNNRVSNCRFANFNGTLLTPMEIGHGCVNLTFTAYPGQRCVLRQTKMSAPVLNFTGTYTPKPPVIVGGVVQSNPVASGIEFDHFDFSGGSTLYAGPGSATLFVDCTYNGRPVGQHGGAN